MAPIVLLQVKMTTTWSITFLPFVLTISVGIVAATSSGPCGQSTLNSRYILDCKAKQLEAVPRLPAGNYSELTLAKNHITRVEGSAFAGVRTKRLDLTENPLIFIAPDAFQGLGDSLESLLLTFDRSASEFPADSFRQVPNLTSAMIDGHGFRSLSGRDFESLRRLERLAITQGPLPSVSADLFRGQKDSLVTLDLSGNELTAVPLEALTQLRVLKTLNLAKNRISSLGGGSLRGLRVESLDLSTQGSAVSTVDEFAFRGLETTLRVLSLASLSLANEHLQALKTMTGIVELDLSRNRITHLGDAFVTMASLQVLNLQDNPIVALNGAVFRNSASLRVLNMGGNNISSMEQDSFSGLTSLADLDLGYSKGLILTDSIFSAQRTTLKILKLQYSTFREFRWSAIENLTELQDLFLAECELSDVPDSVFRNMKRLRSIDLKNNRIDTLRRESLAGLEGSLENLNLLGNRIQTIDECVFRGFTKVSLFQLSLQRNPLRCDCGLRWLYHWFVNVTNDQGYEKNRINWKCSNLNDTNFRDLNDSHFEPCDQSRTPLLPCPETTTQPLPANSSSKPRTYAEPRVRISLKVVATTSETMTLAWELSTNETVVRFSISWELTAGGNRRFAELLGNVRKFNVTGLKPSTTYNACLEITQTRVIAGDRTCLTATTSGRDLDPAWIYGVSFAGGLFLFALFLITVVCCCRCVTSTSRGRRSRDHVTTYDEPKLGNNTKRFLKPASVSPQCQDSSSSTTGIQRTRSIADHLESLTDEERYRLINLLTHSGGSVASLDYWGGRRGGGTLRSPLPRYVIPVSSNSAERGSAKDHYDYIEDDEFYDEISMDDIV